MNNIIVALIISFTKLLSLLPRSFFFVSNSKVWNTLSTPLKKRRKIIEANIALFGEVKNSLRKIISLLNIINQLKFALLVN